MLTKKITEKELAKQIFLFGAENTEGIYRIFEKCLKEVAKGYQIPKEDEAKFQVLVFIIFHQLLLVEGLHSSDVLLRVETYLKDLLKEEQDGIYIVSELEKYRMIWNDYLKRGDENPMNGVANYLLYRITDEEPELFLIDDIVDPQVDLTIKTIFTAGGVVKDFKKKFKLVK